MGYTYTNEPLLKLTLAVNAMAGKVDLEIKGDIKKIAVSANNIAKAL